MQQCKRSRRRSQFASLYVAPDTKSNAHSIDFNIQHNALGFLIAGCFDPCAQQWKVFTYSLHH